MEVPLPPREVTESAVAALEYRLGGRSDARKVNEMSCGCTES